MKNTYGFPNTSYSSILDTSSLIYLTAFRIFSALSLYPCFPVSYIAIPINNIYKYLHAPTDEAPHLLPLGPYVA